MNINLIAQIIGIISIYLFFSISLYIVYKWTKLKESGRIALYWISLYAFFLGSLRVLQLFNITAPENLRILSAVTSVVPLFAVIINLFLYKEELPITQGK